MHERGSSVESSSMLHASANVPWHYGVLTVCGLLVLAVVLVFGETARHDFVNFDDSDYVYRNPHVLRGIDGAGIRWAFITRDVAAQWQPLKLLSLMADVELSRPDKGPLDLARLAERMHLVNVALHAVNTLLLFMLLRTTTSRLWPSAATGSANGSIIHRPGSYDYRSTTQKEHPWATSG